MINYKILLFVILSRAKNLWACPRYLLIRNLAFARDPSTTAQDKKPFAYGSV